MTSETQYGPIPQEIQYIVSQVMSIHEYMTWETQYGPRTFTPSRIFLKLHMWLAPYAWVMGDDEESSRTIVVNTTVQLVGGITFAYELWLMKNLHCWQSIDV